MNLLQHDRVRLFLICFTLATLTAFAYWPAKDCDFVEFDDQAYVTNNSQVQQGLTRQGLAWAFVPGHAANWHPLTWLSHMLDVELFGVKARAHHLVNLFFHIANAILLLLLLRKMTGALWRSAFVAALFALHPLHVESVAWISERKDVLSLFFGLLTIWFYTRYTQKKSSAPGSRFLMFDYSLALIFFGLGLMSKPMLVTIPCVLLLLDFWPLQRMSEIRNSKAKADEKNLPRKLIWNLDFKLGSRLILEKIPFIALTVVSSLLTFIAQKNAGAVLSLERLPFSVRIGNALVSYISYLGKMIWPRDLAVFYPAQVWPRWMIICSALLIFFLSATTFKMAKRRPYFLTGWLWYLGTLIPVIGLVQVGSQSMADRYTYFPLIGIFLVIAWAATELLKKKRLILRTIAALTVGVCAL